MSGLTTALRFIRQQKKVVAIATLIVAPCLGVNLTLFRILDRLMFRSLPYASPGELVSFNERAVSTGQAFATISYPEFAAVTGHPLVKGATAFWYADKDVTYLDSDGATDYLSASVDHEFIGTLGVHLKLGRPFDKAEQGGDQQVIVSSAFWKHELAGATSAVHQVLHFRDRTAEVVGVLPDDFVYPSFAGGGQPDLLFLYHPSTTAMASTKERLLCVARVVGGPHAYSPLQRDLPALAEAAGAQKGVDIRVVDLQYELTELRRYGHILLLVCGGLVLVAAAVTFGIVLLDLGFRREADFRVRVALGAGFHNLALQILSEAGTVVFLGLVVAVLLSTLTFDFTLAQLPFQFYKVMASDLDSRVAVVTVGLALVFTTMACTYPLIALSRPRLSHGASGFSRATRRRIGHTSLLYVQVAIGFALSLVAGSLLDNFRQYRASNLGVNDNNVVVVRFNAPRERYTMPGVIGSFVEQLRTAALAAVPGVAVGGSTGVPLLSAAPEGHLSQDALVPGAQIWRATPGYFAAAGIPILQGRDFVPEEMLAKRGAIVTRAFVSSARGEAIRVGQYISVDISAPPQPVVGIVGDVRQSFDEQYPRPAVYLPFDPSARRTPTLLVRLPEMPMAQAVLLPALKSVDSAVSITVRPYRADVRRINSERRFQLVLFSLMAGLVFLLTTIGVYVVAARQIDDRLQEFKIRLSLGARASGLIKGVLIRYLLVTTIGIVTGSAVAWLSQRALRTVLTDVQTPDSALWVLCAVTFATAMTVAAAAAAMSIRRLEGDLQLRSL